jgi:hypothetical protein
MIGLVLLTGIAISGCDLFPNNQNQRNPLRQFFAPKQTPTASPTITPSVVPTISLIPTATSTPTATETPTPAL